MPRDTHEQRIRDLEREVATLRQKLDQLVPSKPWWERIAGTFDQDPIYANAMKLGRRYRREQKPD